MKIQKSILSGIFLVSNLLTLGQAKLKGDVMVNLGLAKSDLYRKVFILAPSSETGLHPQTQKAAYFFDFNVNYFFKSSKWICKPLVGFGYSPMGFDEKGTTMNDSQKTIDYTLNVKLAFISIYGGLSYTLISKKNFNIRVLQTINPMFDTNKSIPVLRRFGISARTNLTLDIKSKSGGIWCFTPFFQTSITKFNKNKTIKDSPDYYPYCYGINVGSFFKH